MEDFDAEALLRDAIPEALAHEDAKRFLAWVRTHIEEYFAHPLLASADSRVARVFAWSFGRALWNALPLPGNGFRPDPVPEPGRNEPCPCGSGLKYKRCCNGLPMLPLKPENVWPALLDALDSEQRERALRSGALPRSALVALAEKQFEEQGAKSAVKFLEPLLLPRPVAHDDNLAVAFDLLCDAYDELGWNRKKAALIDGVIAEVPRSALRSGAWQRQTLIAMDGHDLAAARAAFREAQRDDPDAPIIALLEVQLLLAEHQPERAGERARFHVRRFRARDYPEDEPPLNFLLGVARDPLGAMSSLAIEMSDEAGRGLRDWLAAVRKRPLPAYRVASVEELPADDVGGLLDKLIEMGIPRAEAERAVREMPEPPETAQSEPAEEAEPREPLYFLAGPEALAATEAAWHECFPLTKPFALADQPFGEDDAWKAAAEARWTTFLEDHPECFDSLDVLDDLATALLAHPQAGLPSLEQALLLPLLERARAIVARAVGDDADVRLAWIEGHNRPPLRALARLARALLDARPDEAVAVTELLLRLNPEDNHGYRVIVVNHRLRRGEDPAALEVAERYPDDFAADIPYGRALALFRLERKDEATRVLRDAVREWPKVSDYLLREKPRRPKLSEFGVTPGGDDEAWLYRDRMLGVWQACPDAMDWLRAEHNRRRRAVGKSARRSVR
jgi:hypothetical protein